MDDGLLEVVGVTGVVHMVSAGAGDRGAGLWRRGPLSLAPPLPNQGQVQGGLRSGIRIAQGSYFRVTLLKATPVQVDGEPWVQAPGHMIISAAGPKVRPAWGGQGACCRQASAVQSGWHGLGARQSCCGWFFPDSGRSWGWMRPASP